MCSASPGETERGFQMRVNKMIAAATLPAMLASPVVAANPAASLSLRGSPDESAATADSSSAAAQPEAVPAAAAGGIPTALILGGLAVVLIVVGAVALGSGHHNTHPASA
jgi:hypothetical protein